MSSALSSSEPIVPQRHVLASRNFRLLWLGQAISTFGDKFSEIAIPIMVYAITGSAVQLGLAFLTQTVAALIFGLFAGVIADRWNRQQTMIWSDVIRAALIFAILFVPLLPLTTAGQLVVLYTLSFIIAAVKQFFLPAKIATIPETVSEGQLMSANSLDQSTMTLIGFVGFAAAGLLVEGVGVQSAFVIDGFTFLVSALFIVLMRLPQAEETAAEAAPKPDVLAGIRAGFAHVWNVPILKGTVLLSLVAPLAVGATQALLLIFARNVLNAGAIGFGLLEGIFGLGIACGAYILARFAADAPRGRLLAWGVVGMGVGQFLAVLIPLLLVTWHEAETILLMAVSLPFFFLGAVCNAAVFIGIRTIVQENAPRAMIGRVFSVIMVVSSMAMAAGASLAGLADWLGVGTMLVVWSLVLVVAGLSALAWKTFREA
ncbi:MAG TPA: MFS transporter [Chloroflexota bacterium]|nr:MFS transporter [Chloroflexota bacterium]